MFQRLGRFAFRRHWLVIGVWLILLIGFNALGGAIGKGKNSGFATPAGEATSGFETVAKYFPGQTSTQGGQIVFQTAEGVDDPDVQAAMTKVFEQAAALDGVGVVSPYTPFGAEQISPDGTIAFAQLNFDNTLEQTQLADVAQSINESLPDNVQGLRIELGGQALATFEPPSSELIGLAFAIFVLIVAFGSVMAMALPVSVAVAGVGAGGFGLVTLLSHVVSVPDFAPVISLMIGLGVGIDYALFIVTRYRELTHKGVDSETATALAMDTAGRAVLFAGLTVVVSLLGMLFMGLEFISGLGVAAATTVFVTLLASLTLLPALIGLAHKYIEITRWRGLIIAAFIALGVLGAGLKIFPMMVGAFGLAALTLLASFAVKPLREKVPARPPKPLRSTWSFRWSRAIQRRPWLFVIVGGGVLLLLAGPILGLRLGFSDEGNYSPDTTTRQAYDLVAEGFGPGFNGPFILATEVDDPSQAAALPALIEAIAADPGVAQVSPPFPNTKDPATAQAYLIRIVPTTAPQDAATAETVKRLRTDVIHPAAKEAGITANLTGAVPSNIDFTDYLSRRMFVFFGVVLGVSFLLLMVVFRSLLVPLKAVIMNVLSIAAAYGVVVAIFQWGWGGALFGIEPAPIEPFVPMMLFAIVFGLSMDYEVFLLSRVKEEFDRTGDAHESVADGLAATARVITAAAAIMVVVFGSFLLEHDRIVKLFGTGLALAVFLDATLVRMLLVPATMELLGDKNWWIPKWLGRILPHLNVEGPEDASIIKLITDDETMEPI